MILSPAMFKELYLKIHRTRNCRPISISTLQGGHQVPGHSKILKNYDKKIKNNGSKLSLEILKNDDERS